MSVSIHRPNFVVLLGLAWLLVPRPGGDQPVIGSSARLSLRDSVLMNGLLIHGLDFDDTHLNFRIVVDVKSLNETTRRVTATTLVHRNNIVGRVYLATVMPFHKLIVPTMLARIVKHSGLTPA